MTAHTNPRPIRVLPPSAAPAGELIASSIALLAGLEQGSVPALRWYQFDPPALLLGSSQRPHDVDLAACAAAGISVHRRRSGGGAVLSEALLLLDLALPIGDLLYTGDVTESYRWLGEVWASALGALGITATLVDTPTARADTQGLDPLLRRVCFGGLSPYEVIVGRRKLVGLAQVRRRGGALFQAGVYLQWAPERTAALIAANAADRVALAGQLAERVAGLHSVAGGQVTADALMNALGRALEQLAGLVPTASGWTDAELQASRAAAPQHAALDPARPS